MSGATRGRPTVLFLAGEGRSGSTLLERVLGRLPGVAAAGEIVHLWERGLRDDERCGCGLPFSACPRWQAVGRHAFGGWQELDPQEAVALRWSVDRQRHLPRMLAPRGDYAAALSRYVERLSRVYHGVALASGAHTVVDSSKHVSTAYLLRHVPDIDLRLLHLVRDSRGVAYSWTRTVERPERDGSFMPRYRPEHVAAKWLGHNAALHGLEHLGVAVTRMTYEDFVARPRPELERVAAAVGLDPESVAAVVQDRTVQLGTDHTVAGNPMRFRTGATTLRVDSAWRRELNRRDQRLVRATTWPLLRAYGYDR